MNTIIDAQNGNITPQLGVNGSGAVFASAVRSGVVNESDSTVLQFKAIYVSGTGDVAIKHTESGSAITYSAVPAGTILPVSGVRVMSTGTTATNMVWMDW